MTILKGFRADFEGNGYITVTKTADYERSIAQLRQFKTRKKIRNALKNYTSLSKIHTTIIIPVGVVEEVGIVGVVVRGFSSITQIIPWM